MTHILTLDTLKAKGACPVTLDKFSQLFPNGAPVTIKTFVDVADQFNWDHAAKLLLRDGTYEDKWTALDVKHRPEWAALDAKHDAEWRALDAKYDAEWDALDAKYDAECATLFATLYIDQESQTS